MKQDFFEQVYEIVRLIPRGRVSTYGNIAVCFGSKSTARMVGWAMNHAHHQKPFVPAHRVVNRVGLLSGRMHFHTPQAMQERLEAEGVIVVNNKIQDFKCKLWIPLDEITL